MRKKFLVLGSNSFSGSNFINFLLKKDLNVIGVSRSDEYKKIYLPYKNSPNLKNFKFYKININNNLKKLKLIVKRFKPNHIINYIAQGMVSESWLNPEDWYNTNIIAHTQYYDCENDSELNSLRNIYDTNNVLDIFIVNKLSAK